MIDRDMIAPAIHRLVDLTAGPVNILVPPGQAYEIYRFLPSTQTSPNNVTLQIGEKMMFWAPHHTGYRPMTGPDTTRDIWSHELYRRMGMLYIPWIAQEGQNITIASEGNETTCLIAYRKHDLKVGLNEYSDGGKMGNRRLIFSWAQDIFAVGAGLSVWHQMIGNQNPPGETTFPWIDPVNPDRRYHLVAFLPSVWRVIGANLTCTGIRLSHEGRDLITDHPVIELDSTVVDIEQTTIYQAIMPFPEPYGIDSNEVLQAWVRITSTDLGPQNATYEMGLLMIEEFLHKAGR